MLWLTVAGFGPPWALFSVFEKVGLYYIKGNVEPVVESAAYYYAAFGVALAIALGRTAIILNITFARERLARLPDKDQRLTPLSAYWWCNPYGLAVSSIFVFGDGVGRIWAQVSMWDALGGLYFAAPDGLFVLPAYFATCLSIALLSGVFRVSWWIWYWGAFSKLNGPRGVNKPVDPAHPLAGTGGLRAVPVEGGGGAGADHNDSYAQEYAVRHRAVRTPSAADLMALSPSGDDDDDVPTLLGTTTNGSQASLSSLMSAPPVSPDTPNAPGDLAGAAAAGAREDGGGVAPASASAASSAAPWYKRVLARVRRLARSVYPAVVAIVPMPVHRGVQYLFRYMDGFGRTWAMFAVFNQFTLASPWSDGDGFFTKEAYVWTSISFAFLGGCYVVFKGTYRRFKVFLH